MVIEYWVCNQRSRRRDLLTKSRHGRLSTVLKLEKLFAENGAAAVQFENQLHSGKAIFKTIR
ncbi:hypothetical protein V8E54_013472 [Elaphomyces granulatus]